MLVFIYACIKNCRGAKERYTQTTGQTHQEQKRKTLKRTPTKQKYTKQRNKKCQHTDHYQKPEKSGHKPQKSKPHQEKNGCQEYDADATMKNE